MSTQSTKERKAKYNELSNNLNINIRKKPIDLSIKNKEIIFCSNLPFAILLFPLSYVANTESTNSFFCDLENEYKIFGTKSKQIPKMFHFSRLLKKMKEDQLKKAKEDQLSKIKEDQLKNTMKEFKNELKDLKNKLNKIKELELLREQEINEIKNEAKKELSILDDEISDLLEELDVDLTTLELRCKFCGKPHDFKRERELRLLAKEKINEIERLKEEVENNKDKLMDHLLDGEEKISKLLTDLKYEKHDT